MTQVTVKQGVLEGEVLDLVTGDGQYYSFKGIPYAAPPIGELRFKAPQPPIPWEGVKKVTEHGPICPQRDIFTEEILPGSEDCLYLNVYTKTLAPESPLPVMVFLHGGGFQSGSGNEDNYGPDFLVNHDVVLVTINYRLDTLGFLCLDTEEVPGNAGLKDQVAALKWIKENIASFGGNPDNVTIFGESAGGASVMFHVISPLSKGLFNRAISMSGVPTCDWAVSFKPRERAFILGKQLGLDTKDPKELLQFLQSVPVENLIDTNPTLISSELVNHNKLKMYHFTPVVEKDFGQEYFLTEAPLDAIKKGKINDVDLLIGHTNEETLVGIPFMEKSLIDNYARFPETVVPRKLQIKCNPETILEVSNRIHEFYFNNKPISLTNMKEFIKYANDTCFIYDIQRVLNNLPEKANNRKYFYKFSCYSERNLFGKIGKPYDIIGASHLDDCLYLFDAKRFKISVDKNSKEYKLITLVNTVFTNFAKYGTPTPDNSLGVIWPQYNPNTKEFVDIGDQLTIGSKSDEDCYEFWKSIFEYANVEF